MAQYDGQHDARLTNKVQPYDLTYANNVIAIPRGSYWPFKERGAVLDITVDTIETADGNFFLGTSYPVNPNVIDKTVASRCFGAGNTSCTIAGTVSNGSIIGSGACDITNNTGALATGNRIIDSQTCSIQSSGTGRLVNNSVADSFATTITTGAGTTGQCVENGVQQCENCAVNVLSAANTTTANNMTACQFCLIGNPLGATANTILNQVTASDSCFLNPGAQCTIHSAVSSSIGGNPRSIRSNLTACLACGHNNSVSSAIIGSENSTCTSSTTRSAIVAANNAALTAATNCLATGTSPVINTYSNTFAHGATATSSNQVILGTRLDVTGGTVNTAAGYTNSAYGYTQNLRITTTTPDTLLATDGHLFVQSTQGVAFTLNVPSAAAMGANYPLNTSKVFKVTFNSANYAGNSIVVTGNFNNNPFFNTYRTSMGGETVDLVLHNTPSAPFWELSTNAVIEACFTAPVNSFGLTPPKSDAAQLPTSTSEATHKALTTTSYVTFTVNPEPTYWLLSGGFIKPNVAAEFFAEYEVQIKTVSGGGSYLIRADMVASDTGATLPDSYVEQGGTNTIPGVIIIRGKASRFYADPFGTTLSVRISQDSSNLINASASITLVRLWITAKI